MNGETIAMIKALQAKSIEELKTSGGTADAGKVLTVGSDGRIAPIDLPVGEGQIALDGSLSVSGAAADAKVVGDAISAVNGSLVDVGVRTVGYNSGNLFDGKNYTASRYWNENGEQITNANWLALDTIDVTGYDTLIYKNIGSYAATTVARCLWMNGETILEAFRAPVADNTILIVPEEATGIRLSVYKNSLRTFEIKGHISGTLENIDFGSIESKINYVDVPKNGLTWDWWFSEHVTDKFGNVYVGYIDKDKNIGVMFIRTDGKTLYHPLTQQATNDDHNSCGVKLLDDGRVIVMSTHGHASADKIQVFIATEPYSVDCDFIDKSFSIAHPVEADGYYELTYSQIFIYNGIIYDFFRCYEKGTSDTHGLYSKLVIGYVKSTDEFDTYTFGGVARINDIYCKFKETDTFGLIRMCITKNSVQGDNKILHGFLNLATETIEAPDGTVLGNLTEIFGNEWISTKETVDVTTTFDAIVSGGTSFKIRLLDVAKTSKSNPCVLYGKSDQYSGTTTFTYVRYANGINTEIGNSGMPFYKVSYYLPGCVFAWDENTIISCNNESQTEQDGRHVMKLISINDTVTSKDILHSARCLLRPLYADCGKVVVCSGKYNDISGTPESSGNNVFMKWDLMPVIINV